VSLNERMMSSEHPAVLYLFTSSTVVLHSRTVILLRLPTVGASVFFCLILYGAPAMSLT